MTSTWGSSVFTQILLLSTNVRYFTLHSISELLYKHTGRVYKMFGYKLNYSLQFLQEQLKPSVHSSISDQYSDNG